MATVQGWRPALAVALAVVAAVSMLPNVPVASGSVPGVAAPHLPPPTGPVRTTVEVAPGFAPPPGTVDLGPLPPTTRIAIAIGLPSRDPAALAAWDAEASIPGSPAFHHPLSSSEAAARFGASPRAIDGLTNFLGTYGLRPAIDPDGLLAYVQGTSATLGSAFGTSFEEYRAPSGRLFYSHAGPASLPTSFPWTGVLGLGNSTPVRPALDPSFRGPTPGPAAGCSTGGGIYPCAIEQAYNATPLLSAGTNGSGERIAVVDAYSGREPQPQLESDLAQFATDAGVAVGNVEYLYPVPASGSLNTTSTNPDWGLEEALDLEWARGIAPGATVEMTFSPNSGPGLYAAIDWLVAHKAADVISLSWGEPDVGVYNAYSGACAAGCNASTDGSYAILGPVLELAAAEGIGVFAASGDCGAADGTSGVATNFPASDPYVTGVGGTTLSFSGTAYGSEVAWGGNDTGAHSPGCQNQGGSGGGYSPFPHPWWQSALPAGQAVRGVPDVAANAGSYVQVVYQGSTTSVGGTSASTPVWAGFAAIADSFAGVDLGLLNPSLYAILGSPRYAVDFHDVTSGDNGYHARAGWDPVTGLGSPIVNQLVVDLARGGGLAGGGLATYLYATPTAGHAPLTVSFTVSVMGGSGTYPLEGVTFGTENASLTSTGTVRYTFPARGVYWAQSFVFDSGGNASVSPPLPIVVGGGAALNVTLRATPDNPTPGSPVTFTASASGGTAPYNYTFWFGDGASRSTGTSASTSYTYPAAGLFCAVVVATDNASPEDGGASPASEIEVGTVGAACGNGTGPLTVTAQPTPAPRDAPADFPALFNISGGASGNGAKPPTLSLSSSDPYVTACNCAVVRHPGNYTINETAVDSKGAEATGTTTVSVGPPLRAVFTATRLNGTVPLTVGFSATVSGGLGANASTTAWQLAGGPTVVGSSATFTFSVAGEYPVTADVEDRGSGNASETFLIDAEPAGSPPPVGFSGTVTPSENVSSGATVTLTGSIVGAPAFTTLYWHLGDGHSAVGPTVRETYFWNGSDPADQLKLLLYPENVGIAPVAPAYAWILPSFFATESGGFAPEIDALSEHTGVAPALGVVPVSVTATGQVDGPGGAGLLWQFGDGGTASGSPAPYSYLRAGNYTAVATASDGYSDAAVQSTAVWVVPALTASTPGPSPSGGDAPLPVSFDVLPGGGDGGPYLVEWTFGNGATSYVTATTYTYDVPGKYVVTLEIVDNHYDTAKWNWTVSVSAPIVFPITVLAVGAATGIALAAAVVAVERRRPRPPIIP
ncbi:MAG TPA: PKD domain-containing protein [Thermoplasmata archaeon]|nr:PKD domain-containing protein [Thermoplasmata archaeon]